ncbi:zinc finger protein 680-like [Penaeus monodon]|uniref:zinc finger protein 680-like n=1 Tax=Penaeus monodon TaxID=6687 RepID=UPI0018A70A4C|nr:zinc finger protein 680-like [Penaeus monodon]
MTLLVENPMTINDPGSVVFKMPPFLSRSEKRPCVKNPNHVVGRKRVNRTNQEETQRKDEHETRLGTFTSLEKDKNFGNTDVNGTERQENILKTHVCENIDETTELKSKINEQNEDIHMEPCEEPQTQRNPFETSKIHDCLLCCTNGHFRMTAGPFSEFESNCGCTTHGLVDWTTRVTWCSLSLRHQYKVHEVTNLSSYRSQNDKRVLPFSRVGFHKVHRLRAIGSSIASPVQGVNSASNEDAQHKSVLRELLDTSPHIKEEAKEISLKYETERPYVCPHPGCRRSFCRNEELTRHTRIHSGHRPFLCLTCNRRFVRRDHLAKHERTHLPPDDKRTYECPLPACCHRYTRSDALTRHMWTAHHIRARQPSRPRVASSNPGSQTPHALMQGR